MYSATSGRRIFGRPAAMPFGLHPESMFTFTGIPTVLSRTPFESK